MDSPAFEFGRLEQIEVEPSEHIEVEQFESIGVEKSFEFVFRKQ